MLNNVKEINLFLENWKKEAATYYLNLREELITQMDLKHEITFENLTAIHNIFDGSRVYSDEKANEIVENLDTMERRAKERLVEKISYDLYREWRETKTKNELKIAESIIHNVNKLDEILDKEVEKKEKDLVKKIEKKAGKILDASDMRVAGDGSLNGTIVGDIKTVEVRTILAGGYNVQVLHYRVLVK